MEPPQYDNLDLSKVQESIKKSKQELGRPLTPSLPPTSLPSGTHVGKLVQDPTGKSSRICIIHKDKGYYVLCSDALADANPTCDYPVCAICKLALPKGSSLRRREIILFYFYLRSTT
jgi:hypothetical protein